MAEIIAYGLMFVGAVFTFFAALGVLRMPDLFMRLHANTKSATFGVGFIMLGVAVYFSDITITTRAVAVILFLLVTAPVSSHLLARAAYFSGVPLWEKTLSDDLRGHYDPKTHRLSAEESAPAAPPGSQNQDGGTESGPALSGD